MNNEQVAPATEEPKKTDSNNSKFRENLSTVGILILAPVLALLMINFVFQTYEVDGESMETTLHNQDRLIVDKVPRTWAAITGNDYIPKRYDIIVFTHKGEFSGSSTVTEKQLIKRVIGLPGDRVTVKDGVVRVSNASNPNGFLVDQFGPENQVIHDTIGDLSEEVKPGHVFVMGDNRGNSLDSRNFGQIDAGDIVGKLSARILPFDQAKKF